MAKNDIPQNQQEARLLVVEDAELNRELIRGLLMDLPLAVDTAESGEEALHLLSAEKKETGTDGQNTPYYDLILLDIHLPGINGIEVLHAIRKLPEYKKIPIICLTGETSEDLEKICRKEGFSDCMRKPVAADQLLALLRQYIPWFDTVLPKQDRKASIKVKELPEWLLQVQKLQAEKGLSQCGSIDGYLDALRIFANVIEKKADEITQLFESHDRQGFTNQVHSLKSMARQIGAEELADLAEKLEKSEYTNERDRERDVRQLLDMYQSFYGAFHPLLEEPVLDWEKDGNDFPVITQAELADAYQTLGELAVCYDYDSIMIVLESLKQYRIPEEEKSKFRKVWAAASCPDWDRLQDALGGEYGKRGR